jgi:hypothetical protein
MVFPMVFPSASPWFSPRRGAAWCSHPPPCRWARWSPARSRRPWRCRRTNLKRLVDAGNTYGYGDDIYIYIIYIYMGIRWYGTRCIYKIMYHVVYYCNMYYIVITYSIIAVLMMSYAVIWL